MIRGLGLIMIRHLKEGGKLVAAGRICSGAKAELQAARPLFDGSESQTSATFLAVWLPFLDPIQHPISQCFERSPS